MVESASAGNPTDVASSPKISRSGAPPPAGFQRAEGSMGNIRQLNSSSPTCTIACRRGETYRTTTWPYEYPTTTSTWKNTRHVVHTGAAPPNHGKIRFPTIGCTRNKRNADRNAVAPRRSLTARADQTRLPVSSRTGARGLRSRALRANKACMSILPRGALLATTSLSCLATLAIFGCSPAPEPHTATPATASAVVTAQATATATASAASTAPPAGPVPLVFEAKRIPGVHLSAEEPSVAFAGDGTFIVESGGVAELCDLPAWKSVRPLPTGLSNWTASADGKLLAALDEDDDAVLVDPATGDERGRLPAGRGSIALSADGAALVVVRTTAFDKFRGAVWSTAKGTTAPLRRIDGVQAVPGTLGALAAPDRAVFFAHSEPAGPTLIVETRPPQRLDLESPIRFALAPEGSAAVVSGKKGDKVTVLVLDLPGGQERLRFEVPPPEVKGGDSSAPYVRTLSVSKMAIRVALAVGPSNGPGAVMVFDGRTGALVAGLEQPVDEWLEAATLALSPDGKRLLWVRHQKPATPDPAGAPPKPRPFEIAVAALP